LLGQFIGEDSRSHHSARWAYFIEVCAVANDLFLAKRASRLFLSNVGKGIYSIPPEKPSFWKKSGAFANEQFVPV
jgi:hypothetical protein